MCFCYFLLCCNQLFFFHSISFLLVTQIISFIQLFACRNVARLFVCVFYVCMCLCMSGQTYKKRPTEKSVLTSCASTTCNAQMGTHGRPRGGSNNPPSIKSLILLIVCVWGFLVCRIDNGGPNFWIFPAQPLWNGIPLIFRVGSYTQNLN